MNSQKLEKKRNKEKRIVRQMIGIYCNSKHKTTKSQLCDECEKLAQYADKQTDRCPRMEQKTFCQNCPSHCYNKTMREEIRKVMRFAGPRMIFYNPIAALRHLFSVKYEKLKLKFSKNKSK